MKFFQSDRFRRALFLAFAAGGVFFGAIAGGVADEIPAEFSARYVVMVVIDAARPDRFSCYGYPRETTPNICRFAEGAALFTKAFAQATFTRLSLPSIFHSRYFAPVLIPFSDRLPLINSEDLFTALDENAIALPKAMALQGFHTALISDHGWLQPNSEFTSTFDEVHGAREIVSDAIVPYAVDWMERNSDRPFFLYLHVLGPHWPRPRKAGFALFNGSRALNKNFSPLGDPLELSQPLAGDDRRYLDALYDGRLRDSDAALHDLFTRIQAAPFADRTMLVITADHGEDLLEVGGRYGHGGPWLDKTAQVPLIVYAPGALPPGKYSMPVESIDIMPTILDIARVPLPPGKSVDGISLKETVEGRVRPRQFVLAPGAIQDLRHKLLLPRWVFGNRCLPDWINAMHLYDLKNDPLEVQDLKEQRPAITAWLLQTYLRLMAPKYHRYWRSRTHAMPRKKFFIGAGSLQPSTKLTRAGQRGCSSQLAEAPESWLTSFENWNPWIRSPASSDELRVTTAVPNGVYRVSAIVAGRGRISLRGAIAQRTMIEFPMSGCPETTAVDLGIVGIQDETFEAAIAGETLDAPFVLKGFGFAPLADEDAGAAESGVDESVLRQLKSLGYL